MNSMNGMPAGSNMRNAAGNFASQVLGKRSSNSGKGNLQGDVIPEGYNAGQLQQFTPEMMDLFSQMINMLGPDNFLARLAGGDESMFEQMEQPAWRKFQEAQGQLGSRFSQLAPGAMSAQRGSGFQNQAGQLGSDFAMNLASNRQNLQRQAFQDMSNMTNSLLQQRPYERTITEEPKSWWEAPLSGFASGAGNALGKFAFGG